MTTLMILKIKANQFYDGGFSALDTIGGDLIFNQSTSNSPDWSRSC